MSAPGLKITNFHYTDVAFKHPTEFVEYPKWIHMSGYPSTIAQDAEHEAELLKRPPISGDVTVKLESVESKAVATPPSDERELLLQVAKEKNIKIDGRWKIDRIRLELEKAKEG